MLVIHDIHGAVAAFAVQRLEAIHVQKDEVTIETQAAGRRYTYQITPDESARIKRTLQAFQEQTAWA